MIDPTRITLPHLQLLPERISRWAAPIFFGASMYGLDPVALAAIMERESEGGDTLTPKGPKGTGDNGHGRGLMQIDDRWHSTFVASGLWKEAPFAVLYAARLLRMALDAFDGDYPAAIGAYNAGVNGIRSQLMTLPPSAKPERRIAIMDEVTTDHYVAGVLRIRDDFLHRISGSST